MYTCSKLNSLSGKIAESCNNSRFGISAFNTDRPSLKLTPVPKCKAILISSALNIALNYSKHPTLLCEDFQISFNLEQGAWHRPNSFVAIKRKQIIIPPSHMCLMCASMLTLSLCKKRKINSIKRFDISWRNTTGEQYSLWQTAGRVRGRLQSPTKMSPPGFATTALTGKNS